MPARRSSYFCSRGARATANAGRGDQADLRRPVARYTSRVENGTQVASRRLASQKSLSASHMFARYADADFPQPTIAERKAVRQSIKPSLAIFAKSAAGPL